MCLRTHKETLNFLQCGRIYKDAEMEFVERIQRIYDGAFNVAASIKMRKFA